MIDFSSWNWGSIGIQLIGYVATTFGFLGYQAKKRKGILLSAIIASTLWTVHFLLLGGMTGAIMNICAIIRAFIYIFKGRVKFLSSIFSPLFFSAVFIVIGFMTGEGLVGFLAVLSLIISSFSLFFTKEQLIRACSFLCSPPFLIYDLIKGSYAGVVAEILVMISIIVALIRYRKKDQNKKGIQKDESV